MGSRSSSSRAGPGTELQTFVDVVIAPMVGPEVIAGSTRLKAGTATKLVLNMLTTIAMVHTGKTYGNLMVDVKTGSEKARDRARRIMTVVTGLDYDAAGRLLRRARWNVKAAIVMEKTDDTYSGALSRLKQAGQSVRGGNRGGCGAHAPTVVAHALTTMHTLDLLVLGVYLAAVVALGVRFSRRQTTIRDYFLTDQQVPWWAPACLDRRHRDQHRDPDQRSGIRLWWET